MALFDDDFLLARFLFASRVYQTESETVFDDSDVSPSEPEEIQRRLRSFREQTETGPHDFIMHAMEETLL